MARTDLPSRQELTGRQEELDRNLNKKLDDMEVVSRDNELTADTTERLDFNGTDDGTREVEAFMRAAQDITVDRFEEEDRTLESHQGENRELEGELEGRSDSTERDREQVEDTADQMKTQDALAKVRDAAAAVSQDLDFLRKTIDDAVRQREDSVQEQQQLEARIRRT